MREDQPGPAGRFLLDLHRVALLLVVGLRFAVPLLLRRMLRRPISHREAGVALRRFCEEMGLTYLKLGQYLAMRFDLLPLEVCRELENLYESVQPLPFQVVRLRVETELGRPLEQLFARFQPEPLAAASVAQVHRATTWDGLEVAVKVQRPGIEAIFRADIRNMRRVARVGDWLHVAGRLSAVDTVDALADYTLREMDFVIEGRTADRLRRNAASCEHIPRVHWDLTTRRVLTLEFVEGISVGKACTLVETGRESELEALLPGHRIDDLLGNLAFASLRQLFVTGFFHGDPHPGNVLFLKDGRVAFLDFGICGVMGREDIDNLSAFMESLAAGNVERAYHHYARLSVYTPDTDVQAVHRGTVRVLRAWYEASQDPASTMKDRHLGRYWGEMIELFRTSHVLQRPDNLLFWRALLILDATSLRMAHRFDLLQHVRAFFQRIQPGPRRRLEELLSYEGREEALRELALRPRAFTGRGLRARREAERATRRADASLLGAAAMAATAISASVAATSGALGATARAALAAAALLLLAGSALRRTR
ncbi:MAG TPA: AarF/ABC1/UbiB kinase family protein [Myxococcales bacterium]|nr:AarF/ABC1/UbiB kinase family protein [Myxococcales bacterium]